MAKELRIKRRLAGDAGPPATLLNAEIAFNEIGGVLYYGRGLGANNVATEIVPIAGFGAFVGLTGTQNINGIKTFMDDVYLNGFVFAQTPEPEDNSPRIATTAFVRSQNYATLVNGVIPAAQLPGFVDDIVEYGNITYLPPVGEPGKLYITTDTGITYRWSGSTYVEIVASPGSSDAIVEGVINLFLTPERVFTYSPVKSVAGRTGDVYLTQADVGLSLVDNTPDLDKPISTSMQLSLDAKADLVHVHTINDVSNLPSTLGTIAQTLLQKVNTTDIIDGGGF